MQRAKNLTSFELLGSDLKGARRVIGMTRKDLADRVGISYPTKADHPLEAYIEGKNYHDSGGNLPTSVQSSVFDVMKVFALQSGEKPSNTGKTKEYLIFCLSNKHRQCHFRIHIR